MEEIKIQIPEGYEGIDEEASNLAEGKIVFKKREKTPWRYNKDNRVSGYYVTDNANVESAKGLYNVKNAWNVFATEKQAKSMQAMAQLSQIMQNDPRFGRPITDVEWNDINTDKHCISRFKDKINIGAFCNSYHFLAFHTKEQRNLFLKENEDLIRQYFMLD